MINHYSARVHCIHGFWVKSSWQRRPRSQGEQCAYRGCLLEKPILESALRMPNDLVLTCMSMVTRVSRVSTSICFGRGFGVRFSFNIGCTAQAHCHDQEKGPHGEGEESFEGGGRDKGTEGTSSHLRRGAEADGIAGRRLAFIRSPVTGCSLYQSIRDTPAPNFITAT